MILYPNAKVNFGLNITSKRDDGYHNIQSIIYPIPFFDILEVVESKTSNPLYSGLTLQAKDEYLQNLYSTLRKKDWIPCLDWHLHKQIPIKSGLGGGSSDLAHFAIYLRKYDLVRKHWNEIEEYVLQLSTDAFYFLHNKPALVEGKGDVLNNIDLDLSGKHLLLIFPDISIDTGSAYDQLKIQASNQPLFSPNLNNINDWKRSLINVFEDNFSKIYIPFSAMKESLYESGALYVSLTGSGSVFYALFDVIPDDVLSLPHHEWLEL